MSNPPVFAISPKYTTLDFPNGKTLENKIEVFVDRIEGWQIGIAKQIIQHEIQNSGFALLHIVFSYFEMLGKYLDGYVGDNRSKFYFKRGVKATFPEIGTKEEELINILYKSVRNGLYHLGMTKINTMLSCNIPGSIGFNTKNKLLIICPDLLVKDLDIRFHDYVADLRNPNKIELRKNFETRFDYDNSDASL